MSARDVGTSVRDVGTSARDLGTSTRCSALFTRADRFSPSREPLRGQGRLHNQWCVGMSEGIGARKVHGTLPCPVMVGRDQEFRRSRPGRQRVNWCSPGVAAAIGKSRLAPELTDHAKDHGGVVLNGAVVRQQACCSDRFVGSVVRLANGARPSSGLAAFLPALGSLVGRGVKARVSTMVRSSWRKQCCGFRARYGTTRSAWPLVPAPEPPLVTD
jgi:hypothetical protein